MPSENLKPKSANLSEIPERLLKADVRFILVGGLAVVVQGAPVTTMDVNIVHEQSPGNIAKLHAFLESVDAFYRRPDDRMIRPQKSDLSTKGHLLLVTRFGPLDVLAVIENGKTYEDLLSHIIEIDFKGQTLYVLKLEMLIRLKSASTETRDSRRLAVLEETLRQVSIREGKP